MASDNRHLQQAKARLEGIPKRAVEQGWETSDPLLNETLTAIAHALIAQVEIGRETLSAINLLTNRITGINVQSWRTEYRVPHEDMRSWAKYYMEQEMKKHTGDEPPPDYGWFARFFGGNK